MCWLDEPWDPCAGTERQVIVEDGEVITVKEACYREILDAEGDDIVIESRLLEWLEEMKWFRRGG